MIISHKHRFIFIKTSKTAGTSIEVFLSPHCGEDDVVTPIIPHVEPHVARNHSGLWNPLPELISNRFKFARHTWRDLRHRRKFVNHLPARNVRGRVPKDVWNGYFKFCVERNPWDKTLSHYHMVSRRIADSRGDGITFDEYLERGDFCTNIEKYTDRDGRLLVDRVLKYEHLNDELDEVFQQLGIPFDGSLGVKAKSEFRKDRRPYQEVISDSQRSIIDRAFADEIRMHGYHGSTNGSANGSANGSTNGRLKPLSPRALRSGLGKAALHPPTPATRTRTTRSRRQTAPRPSRSACRHSSP